MCVSHEQTCVLHSPNFCLLAALVRVVFCAPGGWGGEHCGGDTPGCYTKPHKIIQSPNRLYKAPEDYTKPQKTTQSQERLYKPEKTIQRPEVSDKDLQYSTRVATNINLAHNIQYIMLTTTYMN